MYVVVIDDDDVDNDGWVKSVSHSVIFIFKIVHINANTLLVHDLPIPML